MTNNNLNNFFMKMWDDYCKINPHAKAVASVLEAAGEPIVNDHIALRTFSLPEVNKDQLSTVFLNYGYQLAGDYKFEAKKLTAKHFEHSDESLPKVFISQIEIDQLPLNSQDIIKKAIATVEKFNFNNEETLFSGRLWQASYAEFESLQSVSEYAAWVFAHGYRPNHFTIDVNKLKNLNDIYKLNAFLKKNNFRLNNSGGEVKGTPNELLEQSSTMASEIKVKFSDGSYLIPGCYYEFAKRYPKSDGKLYTGFIAASADKIFESTNQKSL